MKLLGMCSVLLLGTSSLASAGELSLALAQQAAQSAVKHCEASGYHVTAAVVDRSGELKVLLKGDDSSVHTRDTAFRKAYTVVTLGPIFNYETSSEIAKAFNGKPAEVSFAEIPNIALLSGAAAIKVDGKIVASLGVGGAPGGDKDEACALKGIEEVSGKLSKS
jgi:uncharacterized protein GlcG (DUF336 family)